MEVKVEVPLESLPSVGSEGVVVSVEDTGFIVEERGLSDELVDGEG